MDAKTEGRILFILGLSFALATFVAERMAPNSPLVTNLAALASATCFLAAIWLTLPKRIRWRCWEIMPGILMALSVAGLLGSASWMYWRSKHPLKEPLPDYVYVIPDALTTAPFKLAIINPGKNPVLNVSLRIFDAKKTPSAMMESPVRSVGDIEPGYVSINVPPIPAGYYQIDIRSRAGRFVEMLQILDVPDGHKRFKLAIGIAGKNSRLPPSDPDM